MYNQKSKSGLYFLGMGILTFLIIGLELLQAVIESKIYGTMDASKWSSIQLILHWIIISIIWGIGMFLVSRKVKEDTGFKIVGREKNPTRYMNYFFVLILSLIAIILSYKSWNGFKIVSEFNKLGLIKFIFQYIYYFMEVSIFMFIIALGQKAGENIFKINKFPWGGILLSLTWGLGHIVSQGLATGIESIVDALIFGLIYVLVNKNFKKAFIIVFILFII